jgi:metallo-beta-lactamase family protein
MPILRDPEPYPECDILFTESTYGDRNHAPASDMSEALAVEIDRIVKTKGKVIIPAFSVGRTQNILYYLRVLRHQNRIPSIPVFVDSPLSTRASRVDEETLALLQGNDSPLAFSDLEYVASVDDSKALNKMEGPAIILSASGMCESGRILHHLKSTIEDKRNTILLVGFMARNTLGRRLVDREGSVRIFGKTYDRRARISRMNGFSAHGDRNDLIASADHLKGRLKTIYLIHGEPRQTNALKEALLEAGHTDIRCAKFGATEKLI